MKIVRWLLMIPVGYFMAFLIAWGFLKKILTFVSFNVAFFEGLSIYLLYLSIPAITLYIAMNIAPKKSNYVKWIILVPHILAGFFLFVPALASVLLTNSSSEDTFYLVDGFNSLGFKWQVICSCIGYLLSIGYLVITPYRELATES